MDTKKLILLLFILSFFNPMAGTLVIPALPFIAQDLQLSSSEASWIFIGYEVMLIAGSVIYGKLAQSIKLRTLFTASIVMAAVGGLLAVFSTNLVSLVLARMLQGAALSAPIPLAMMIINQYFPRGERKKALTYIALAITLGTGISPIIGGVATSWFGWKSIFAIIASVVVLLPFVRSIPDSKIEKVPFPIAASGLLIAAFLSMLYGIHGHPLFFSISLIAWGLFFTVNHKKTALVEVKAFRQRPVAAVSALNLLLMLVINSLFFVTPIFLATLNDLSSIEIGLILLPGAVFSIVSVRFIGKAATKIGSEKMLSLSIAVLGMGVVILLLGIGNSAVIASVAFLFIYIGFGTFNSELSNFTSTQLPGPIMAEGIGLSNLFFFTGATFGPAVMGIFMDSNAVLATEVFTFSTYHLAVIGMAAILVIMFFLTNRMVRTAQKSSE